MVTQGASGDSNAQVTAFILQYGVRKGALSPLVKHGSVPQVNRLTCTFINRGDAWNQVAVLIAI